MATILDLSAELFANILQRIPARQIQLCRAVCRRFHDVVDDNTKSLADYIQAREFDRLTGYTKYHFEYDIEHLSFPDALRRWFSRRPLCPNNVHSLVNYGSQVVYAAQAAKRYPDVSASGMEHPLSLIAQTLIEIQLFVLAGREPRTRSTEDPKEELTSWFELGARGYLQSMVNEGILDLDECYTAALSKDRPLLPRVKTLQAVLAEIRRLHIITPLDIWSVTGIMQAFLCCYSTDDQQHFEKTKPRCHGFCSPDILFSVIGAPRLPTPDLTCGRRPGEGWVAYCVKSPWAYRAVQQALLGDAVALQIAGIMEELFMY